MKKVFISIRKEMCKQRRRDTLLRWINNVESAYVAETSQTHTVWSDSEQTLFFYPLRFGHVPTTEILLEFALVVCRIQSERIRIFVDLQNLDSTSGAQLLRRGVSGVKQGITLFSLIPVSIDKITIREPDKKSWWFETAKRIIRQYLPQKMQKKLEMI